MSEHAKNCLSPSSSRRFEFLDQLTHHFVLPPIQLVQDDDDVVYCSPHTSTPMVMQGRALVLKNTCQNASSTSVEKHLSWSPDIHPTARWVPSTPHRSRPAGRPPNRQPCAAGAVEREYDGGNSLSEAHGPSTVALQQRCHRASAPARRPS